jgi:transposase
MTWRRGQAYGQDLRDRVLGASGSIAEVATRFEVSASYVARARSRRRRLGHERPGAQCNHVSPKLGALEPALAAEVERRNEQTLAQLCAWAEHEHGVRVGLTTMWKTLRRLGLTLKKSASTPASRSEPT